jgi:hypothetical protein
MRPVIKQLLLGGIRPSLDLNFLAESVDSRVTFSGGENGTRINSSGVMVAGAAPRFNYNPVNRSCLGMLIEEGRANLLTFPVDFDNAAYIKSNATISPNVAAGPDGTLTADKLVESAITADHSIRQPVTVTSGATYTFSAYAKAGERTQSAHEIFTGASIFKGIFDLSNGSFIGNSGTGSYTISDAGGGVYRIAVTGVASSTTLNGFIYPASGGVTSYAGDITKGIYLWGAKVEPGAFATSYSGNATRTADGATFAWAQAEGTYACEFDVITVAGTRPILSLDDNSADNRIELYTSGTSLKLTVTTGGVTQADLTLGTVAANTTYKAAFAIAPNDFAAVMSGGAVQTDAAGTVPVVDRWRIGSDQAGNYQNGHAKRQKAFNARRLPNSTLERMVS